MWFILLYTDMLHSNIIYTQMFLLYTVPVHDTVVYALQTVFFFFFFFFFILLSHGYDINRNRKFLFAR